MEISLSFLRVFKRSETKRPRAGLGSQQFGHISLHLASLITTHQSILLYLNFTEKSSDQLRKTIKSAGRVELVVFGAAIKRLRLKVGLTQTELGARIGRERSYISYIENGKQAIELPVIFDLIETLGANPIDILTEVYEAPERRKIKSK